MGVVVNLRKLILQHPVICTPDYFFLEAIEIFLALPLTLQLSHPVFKASH